MRDITLKRTFLTKKNRKTSKLPRQLRSFMVTVLGKILPQVKPGFLFSPMYN